MVFSGASSRITNDITKVNKDLPIDDKYLSIYNNDNLDIRAKVYIINSRISYRGFK